MKKILVIEDNEDSMYLFKFLLEKSGFEVVLASSGGEGITRARRERPDMVITDLMMPGIPASQLVTGLKETLGDAPLVAVTAYAVKVDREKYLSMGLAGYIEKPINPLSFIDEIKSYFSQVPQKRYRNI